MKDGTADAELDGLVKKHHRQHSELEFLARDHDELTLLALQHHPHDIDRRRPKAEIDKLVDKSNAVHREWVQAVKVRDFRRSWLTGLNHTRFHIMLGSSGIKLHELTGSETRLGLRAQGRANAPVADKKPGK